MMQLTQVPTPSAPREQVGPRYFDSSVQPVGQRFGQGDGDTTDVGLGFLFTVLSSSSKGPDTVPGGVRMRGRRIRAAAPQIERSRHLHLLSRTLVEASDLCMAVR